MHPTVLGPTDGSVRVLTGVAGPAARLGHRLTVEFTAWRAEVDWVDDRPVAVRLTVEVESLHVRHGAGGPKALSGPEKALARRNALKCLASERFPDIVFTSSQVRAQAGGFELDGAVTIHGATREVAVPVRVENNDGQQRIRAAVTVAQSAFEVRPFALAFGTIRVADDVEVQLDAMVPATGEPSG